jgi:hypothetical protein
MVRAFLRSALLLMLVGCQAPVPAVTPPPTARPAAPAAPTSTVAPASTVVPTPTTAPVVAAVSPVAPATGTSRVDVLNAASAAYRGGDSRTAAGLYERVSNTPPGAGEAPAASATIDDFAHFRAMVSLLADSREEEAKTHLDALQKRDPSSALARLATQLYDQYGMTGQLRGACAQLQPQVASQAGPTLSALQGLGVMVDAQTLCSAPRGS